MDERNALQNLINLNIGQLLKFLDNVNKNYVWKLEKLNKSFVNNKYGISFNKICINEMLLPNYTNFRLHDPAVRHEDFTDGYRRELLLFQLNKHEENHPIITKQIADLTTTINTIHP